MSKIAFDASFKPTSRVMTPEGYLCVKGVAARTGVYQYLSSELGLDGPARMVGVYRSPDSVFSPDSLATYPHSDVTNDHPSDLVSSETYKDHSVGHVRGVERDGDNVVVDMIIKDQTAIDDINAGKAELSPGYLAEYVPSKGVDPVSGEPYEFEQQDIVINHVAVVEAARAGNVARIFDHKPKGVPMPRKVVLDSKRNLSVTLDEDTAGIVESVISTFTDEAAKLQLAVKDAEAKFATRDAEADKLEEENEELKKETSDSAISARIAQVVAVTDSAKKIVKGFDAKGSTNVAEIKRAAMVAKFPTRDWASKSAAYVEAAFDAEAEKTEDSDEEDNGDGMTKDARSTLDSLARDVHKFRDTRNGGEGKKAYDSFLKGGK